MQLLDIKNLTIEMKVPQGYVRAVEGFSLQLAEGQMRGLVGESGSGKSLVAKAIMGVLSDQAIIRADRLHWCGRDLLRLSARERRQIMGNELGLIFQEASGSLDPTMRVGQQLEEAIPDKTRPPGPWWRNLGWRRKRAIELLHKVGIKQHTDVLNSYSCDLSEGECQKIMIAIAIASGPRLLIADEPTTLLDAHAADQIYRLLSRLNQVRNMAVLLISSELVTVSRWTETTTVLYCGHEVESGRTRQLVTHPRHPYTQALLQSVPTSLMEHKSPLPVLRGNIPALQHLPIGCRLGPRCPWAQARCVQRPQPCSQKSHRFFCHFPLPDAPEPAKENEREKETESGNGRERLSDKDKRNEPAPTATHGSERSINGQKTS